MTISENNDASDAYAETIEKLTSAHKAELAVNKRLLDYTENKLASLESHIKKDQASAAELLEKYNASLALQDQLLGEKVADRAELQTVIDAQTADLAALENEIKEYETVVSSAHATIEYHVEDTSDKKEHIATLKDQIASLLDLADAQDAQIQSLTAEYSKVYANIEELQTELDVANAEAKTTQKRLLDDLDQKVKALFDAEREISVYKEEAESLKATIETSNKNTAFLEQELSEKTAYINESLIPLLAEREQEVEKLVTLLKDQRLFSEEKERELELRNEELVNTTDVLNKTAEELNKSNLELEVTQAKFQEVSLSDQERLELLEAAKLDNAALTDDLTAREIEVSKLQLDVKVRKEDLDKTMSELERLHSELAINSDYIDTLKSKISTHEEKNESLEKEIVGFSAELAEFASRRELLENQLKATEDLLVLVEAELKIKSDEVETWKAHADNYNLSAEDAIKAQEDTKLQVSLIESKARALEEEKLGLKGTLEETHSSISELEAQKLELEQKLDTLSKEHLVVVSASEAKEARLVKLTARIAKMEEDETTFRSEISNLNIKISELDSASASGNLLNEGLKKTLADKESELELLNNEILVLQSSLDEHRVEIEDFAKNKEVVLSAKGKEVSSLVNKVNTLYSEKTSNAALISELKGNLVSLENENVLLVERIENANQELIVIKESLTAAQEDVRSRESVIENLTARNAELNERIAQLETQNNELNVELDQEKSNVGEEVVELRANVEFYKNEIQKFEDTETVIEVYRDSFEELKALRNEEMDDADRRIAFLEQELEKTAAKLEESVIDQGNLQTKAQLDLEETLESRTANYEQKLSDMEVKFLDASDELAKLRKDRNHLQAENDTLQAEIEAYKKTEDELLQQFVRQEKAIATGKNYGGRRISIVDEEVTSVEPVIEPTQPVIETPKPFTQPPTAAMYAEAAPVLIGGGNPFTSEPIGQSVMDDVMDLDFLPPPVGPAVNVDNPMLVEDEEHIPADFFTAAEAEEKFVNPFSED